MENQKCKIQKCCNVPPDRTFAVHFGFWLNDVVHVRFQDDAGNNAQDDYAKHYEQINYQLLIAIVYLLHERLVLV